MNKVEINFVCFMQLQVVGSNVQILKEVSCNFTPCWTLDTSNKIILSLREENISTEREKYFDCNSMCIGVCQQSTGSISIVGDERNMRNGHENDLSNVRRNVMNQD